MFSEVEAARPRTGRAFGRRRDRCRGNERRVETLAPVQFQHRCRFGQADTYQVHRRHHSLCGFARSQRGAGLPGLLGNRALVDGTITPVDRNQEPFFVASDVVYGKREAELQLKADTDLQASAERLGRQIGDAKLKVTANSVGLSR